MIRFRVVTASDDNDVFGAQHYETNPATDWGGLWLDNVIVYGESITG